MALFENYERRADKINAVLCEYGISSIEECKDITVKAGIDCDKIVRETQPICFENAVWAYTVGTAIAVKKGCTKASDAACRYRYRTSVLLHPRLRCREPQGWSRTRKPRSNASFRGDRLLLLPRGT